MMPRGSAFALACLIRTWLPVVLMSAPAVAAPDDGGPAAAGRAALVIGNGTYASQPPIPACLSSARTIAAALRRLDAAVTEQEDPSLGEMDAALVAFASEVRRSAEPVTVIYVCGYGTGFNQRPFLLPATAAIDRPTDVLTQAILVRSVLDTAIRANPGPTVAIFDVVPWPGGSADADLPALPQAELPAPFGLIAATEQPSGNLPTPLATAVVAALQSPPVTTRGVLLALQSALSGQSAVHVAALRLPPASGPLTGTPPPTPSTAAGSSPSLPARASAGAPGPAPAGQGTSPSVAPVASSGVAALPDEAQMTSADIRRMQDALARLGYYDGRIDGVIGAETRAAIRRWQHELHQPMTGHPTAAQASRLVSP